MAFTVTATVVNNQINLQWTTPTAHTMPTGSYYTPQRRLAGNTSWTNLTDINHGTTAFNQRSYTDTTATSGTTYNYRIFAEAGNGFEFSATPHVEITTTGLPTAPGVPTSVSANANSESQITLRWHPPNSGGAVSSYEVQWRQGSSGSWSSSSDDSSPVTFSSLNASTSYQFRVRASNAAGNSSWVTVSRSTHAAPVSPPGIPTNVTATANSLTQITFTWSAPTSGGAVSNYEVEYKLTSASSWTASSDDASPVIFSSLTAATSYIFRVRASNADGNSNWVTDTPQHPNPNRQRATHPTHKPKRNEHNRKQPHPQLELHRRHITRQPGIRIPLPKKTDQHNNLGRLIRPRRIHRPKQPIFKNDRRIDIRPTIRHSNTRLDS